MTRRSLPGKAKRGVPNYSDSYPQISEEEEFWDDLKTGTEKAQEYIDYINKAADHAVNASDLTGLQRLKKVAQGLKDLTEKLNDGLNKFGKRFKQLKQVTAWYGSMRSFAQASLDMNPRDRKSVRHWVDSMKGVAATTEPFIDWVQDKLKGAGSAVFSIVVAQLKVGLAGLDAGVKVVTAYLDRYDAIMKEIERQSGGWGPPKPPPPPEPYPWKSRAERAGEAKVREMTELVERFVRTRFQGAPDQRGQEKAPGKRARPTSASTRPSMTSTTTLPKIHRSSGRNCARPSSPTCASAKTKPLMTIGWDA
jgi:hypothetical protein